MSLLKKIVNIFGFIASGIIAIAVGFFMLRGTMRMWDKNKTKNQDSNDKNSKKSWKTMELTQLPKIEVRHI